MSKYYTWMDQGDGPWFVGSRDRSHHVNNGMHLTFRCIYLISYRHLRRLLYTAQTMECVLNFRRICLISYRANKHVTRKPAECVVAGKLESMCVTSEQEARLPAITTLPHEIRPWSLIIPASKHHLLHGKLQRRFHNKGIRLNVWLTKPLSCKPWRSKTQPFKSRTISF